MKNFVLLLALFCFSISFAQEPEQTVKINYNQLELEAYADVVYAAAIRNGVEGYRTQHAPLLQQAKAKKDIVTNDQILPVFLKEFYDGAVFYKVNYGPELAKLDRVLFVPADLGFLGDVNKEGTEIRLNEALLAYPNLARVVFLRQMGKLYGTKEGNKSTHNIMSPCWEIDAKHEQLAKNIRLRPTNREEFFEAVAEAKPLEKRV